MTRKGKAVSMPRKIAYGMGLAGCAYLFLMVFSIMKVYPSVPIPRHLPRLHVDHVWYGEVA